MIACPSYRDPEVPAEMVFAVPNARLTDWIVWLPLPKLYALLQDITSNDSLANTPYSNPIPDRRIPTFRLPKQDRETGSEEAGE